MQCSEDALMNLIGTDHNPGCIVSVYRGEVSAALCVPSVGRSMPLHPRCGKQSGRSEMVLTVMRTVMSLEFEIDGNSQMCCNPCFNRQDFQGILDKQSDDSIRCKVKQAQAVIFDVIQREQLKQETHLLNRLSTSSCIEDEDVVLLLTFLSTRSLSG